ncbi:MULTISPECIES: hypothetical protein [unclassified Breznakia]|uniref:hypothetical protein n=1 Tax=unclassified Breznakia TaxID=2623764 RepID=UPI002474565C|nr:MULTISPECIES: hypothetical protein [unclassified Breznakia]MDH6367391.1 hypothetical protein [Breznakia sp. PH1-1]MDH6403923.1 hypothetical protein [Breznakia sp. PF1-11]MDH6411632.1 hypothetical protein [Breznakia sp. PFB1-11]MDH6414558.1 hypothetical protein [Breznakia sp. PFB1-14]MDH6418664.1 hypothetical protein [Breznakia sp. PFB1-12]
MNANETSTAVLVATYGEQVIPFLEAKKKVADIKWVHSYSNHIIDRMETFDAFCSFVDYGINQFKDLGGTVNAGAFWNLTSSYSIFCKNEENHEKTLLEIEDDDADETNDEFYEGIMNLLDEIHNETFETLEQVKDGFIRLFENNSKNQLVFEKSEKTFEIIDALNSRKITANQKEKEQYEEIKQLLLDSSGKESQLFLEKYLSKYKNVLITGIGLFILLLLTVIAWRI